MASTGLFWRIPSAARPCAAPYVATLTSRRNPDRASHATHALRLRITHVSNTLGGDRSIYIEDPAGSVAEVWDFFEHGDGQCQGVRAL